MSDGEWDEELEPLFILLVSEFLVIHRADGHAVLYRRETGPWRLMEL